MKKIITIAALILAFASCKKDPITPTPEPPTEVHITWTAVSNSTDYINGGFSFKATVNTDLRLPVEIKVTLKFDEWDGSKFVKQGINATITIPVNFPYNVNTETGIKASSINSAPANVSIVKVEAVGNYKFIF